jgi:hypothetical protein
LEPWEEGRMMMASAPGSLSRSSSSASRHEQLRKSGCVMVLCGFLRAGAFR